MKLALVTFIAALLCWSAPASARRLVYKCTVKKGRITKCSKRPHNGPALMRIGRATFKMCHARSGRADCGRTAPFTGTAPVKSRGKILLCTFKNGSKRRCRGPHSGTWVGYGY